MSESTNGNDDLREELAARTAQIQEDRGYNFDTFKWLAEHDPEFESTRLAAVEMTYTRKDGVLEPKVRELIAICLLAFRMYHSVRAHIGRALREGASVSEVVQALEMASIPGGQATLHFGLDHLIALEESNPELFTNR
jgi:alkylhydroperoxidase/carboxymuconolactone decarboxylase family protein YurZ